MDNAPPKLCECGCGQHAPLAIKTATSKGWIKGQPVRFVHGHNRRGFLSGTWKGGRVSDSRGYFLVFRPYHPHARHRGYVFEHRLVMEEVLGRFLLPTEVVHHKDGNPSNNDPDNLEVFANNAEHMRQKHWRAA